MATRPVKTTAAPLSTPHGALGTFTGGESKALGKKLSTPHGALGTIDGDKTGFNGCQLSTPHGALGTKKSGVEKLDKRNFQLHTVH